MTTTTYTVELDSFVYHTEDTDKAQEYSEQGFTVTAVTHE